MKFLQKVFLIVFVVLIITETGFANTEKGNWEFSAAASFMSMKIQDYDESFTSFRLAGRVGYFLTKNFEIEPEIILGKVDEGFLGEERLGYILSLNLAYNFTSSGKMAPFLLAGGGISNTFPFFPDVVVWGIEDETWILINAGCGVKVFLSKSVALRMEYRFQYYFGSEGVEDFTCHFGLFGVSVFF